MTIKRSFFFQFGFFTGMLLLLLSGCGGGGGKANPPGQLSLNVTPTDLPAASYNMPYTQTVVMTAAGGVGPYIYSCSIVNSEGYPDALAVSVEPAGPTTGSATCTIDGEPQNTAIYSVAFKVLDSTQSAADAPMIEISVNPSPDEAALDHWHVRAPMAQDNNLNDVHYGNGIFVAVGDNGTILTSPSGNNWTVAASDDSNFFYGVVYANGIFVAVGGSSEAGQEDLHRTIMTSPDGKEWTTVEFAPGLHLRSVTYGNGIFVAVGAGIVLTSENGSMWIERPAPVQQGGYDAGYSVSLYCVVYGKGLFVAGGTHGTILTSPDGVVWTERLSFQFPDRYFRAVTYGNGTFVAVGAHVVVRSAGAIIYYSSDGIEWTAAVASGSGLFSVAFGNGTFAAVGSPGSFGGSSSSVLTSVDGKTWTAGSSGTDRGLNGVTYGNGSFIAVGEVGTVIGSSDGFSWSSKASGISYQFLGLTYGDGVFVAVGNSILTSTDSSTWMLRQNFFSDTWSPLEGVAYGNGIFVAVGNSILTSTDGAAWTVREKFSDTWSPLRDVAFGNGIFVAVGYQGAIFTSADGIEWGFVSSGTVDRLETVDYVHGTFLAVGYGDELPHSHVTLLMSRDGMNWTVDRVDAQNSVSGVPNISLENVTHGNGIFVGVGSSGGEYPDFYGTVWTSPDALKWKINRVTTLSGLSAITYDKGIFVAVTRDGIIATSTDGIEWTERSYSEHIQLYDVTYAYGLFVAAGISGNVLTSIDGMTWTTREAGTQHGLFNYANIVDGNGTFVIAGGGALLQSDPVY